MLVAGKQFYSSTGSTPIVVEDKVCVTGDFPVSIQHKQAGFWFTTKTVR